MQRVRRRFADGGLDAALYDRPRPGAAPKLDAKGEAHLVAADEHQVVPVGPELEC